MYSEFGEERPCNLNLGKGGHVLQIQGREAMQVRFGEEGPCASSGEDHVRFGRGAVQGMCSARG